MFQLFSIAFLIQLVSTFATYGVDVSQSTSVSSFQCMKSSGYSFAIVRVYCSSGHPDSNGPATINNAHNGGISYVDGYIFPCYSCGNPAGQMDDTISYLSSHGLEVAKLGEDRNSSQVKSAKVGMLWIDVEGTQYWGSST
jgi:hypothetical protein